MKTKTFFKEFLIFGILLAPLLYLAYLWGSLADSIPVHFDIHGNPDSYASKNTLALILALVAVGMYLFSKFIPRIYRNNSFTTSPQTFDKLRFFVSLFIAVLGIIAVSSAHDGEVNSSFIAIAIAGLFIPLGNYMGNVRPNHFLGKNFLWSAKDEASWKRNQTFLGRLWFFSGIGLVLILFFMPRDYQLFTLFVGLGIFLIIIPVIYSLRLHLKNKKSIEPLNDSKSTSKENTRETKNTSHWVGLFYFNSSDKRMLVPKRVPGMGWTLNFGNPFSYIIIVLIILLIILL